MNLKTLLAINLFGVSLDILTTHIGLTYYQLIELNPFGFNPLREIILFSMIVLSFYALVKYLNVGRIGNILNGVVSLLPYYAFINNVVVIFA